LNLHEIHLNPVKTADEAQFQSLMQKHHYLGSLPKIGHTLRYIAIWQGEWIALISFSSAAWKCAARDAWIGWDFRIQYDRLHLIANNSRFLILPDYHHKNLASRVLSLCENRLVEDWKVNFGYPLLLLETFVDPSYFRGTIYHAANWQHVGNTQGFARTRKGYSEKRTTPKLVFVRPLHRHTQAWLSRPFLASQYQHGTSKIMLPAEQMRMLPAFFSDIPDPRRKKGSRHSLATVLSISVAAILCGMVGYKAIAGWAEDLGQKARARFRCRYRNNYYFIPSRTTIRDVLIRVDPVALDNAIQRWNEQFGTYDEGLAIDGKTMRKAIDEEGRQTHILGVVGHESGLCYTQKK